MTPFSFRTGPSPFSSMPGLDNDGFSFRTESNQYRLRILPETLKYATHLQARNRRMGLPGSLEYLMAQLVEEKYNALAEEGELPPNP